MFWFLSNIVTVSRDIAWTVVAHFQKIANGKFTWEITPWGDMKGNTVVDKGINYPFTGARWGISLKGSKVNPKFEKYIIPYNDVNTHSHNHMHCLT